MESTRLPGPAPLQLMTRALDVTLVVIGAVMVVLVFSNVVTHLFKKDIAWTTEFCEFLMVWVSFLGGAAAARRGAHMTISEFLDKLEANGRRKADGVIQMLCLVVLATLVYYGVIIVNANWGNKLTVLDWPMALQYLALPVGAGISLIFVAYDVLLIFKGVPREARYGGEQC